MRFYFQGRQADEPIDGTEEAASEAELRHRLAARGIAVEFVELADAFDQDLIEPPIETSVEEWQSVATSRLVLTDIDWPFSSMLTFQVKWAAASAITTLLFLPVIWFLLALLGALSTMN